MKLIPIILSLCLSTIAWAKIINIPADYQTIQEGIDASADGDTVLVAPGAYNEKLSIDNKGIVLSSEYLVNPDTSIISNTIIKGDSSSPRLMDVSAGEAQVKISGFTFTHCVERITTDEAKIIIGGYDNPGVQLTDLKIINNKTNIANIISINAPVIMKNVYFADNGSYRINDYLRTSVIDCHNQLEMENVKILNNAYNGLYLSNLPNRYILKNVIIKGNSGRGIWLETSNSFFAENIEVKNNGFEGIKFYNMQDSISIKNSEIANNNYGGLRIIGGHIKYLNLEGVSIHDNRANRGGGLFIWDIYIDIVHLSAENRCSIYNNDASAGSDIFILDNSNNPPENIVIPLDTFTVAEPSWFYAHYRGKSDQTKLGSSPFQIDFQHALRSTKASDLYVSPNGNDNNSGTNRANPLKTISQALRIIEVDSLHPRNIYLAEGIYSSSTNGEIFPVFPRDYVSIIGSGSPENIVLDAEQNDRVFYLTNVDARIGTVTVIDEEGRPRTVTVIVADEQAIMLKNLTITGAGRTYYYYDKNEGSSGGGIFCGLGVNARIERCIIVNNEWIAGGGITISLAIPKIINCTFNNNFYTCDINVKQSTYLDTAFVINSIVHETSEYIYQTGAGIKLVNCITGADSLFVDAENGNYNLPEGSSLIDAGLTFYVHDDDTIVNFEPSEYAGDAPDVGALEVGYDYSYFDQKNDGIKTVDKFHLFQNYPNPFNAITTLSFNLAKPAFTTIKIYNIRGQLVDMIKMSRLDTGYHYLRYNASTLSSGIYFYKIQAGNNFIQTKKMILIK